MDLNEEPEEVIRKAEVPGLSREDLKIDLADNMITLSEEKKKEEDVKEKTIPIPSAPMGRFPEVCNYPVR